MQLFYPLMMLRRFGTAPPPNGAVPENGCVYFVFLLIFCSHSEQKPVNPDSVGYVGLVCCDLSLADRTGKALCGLYNENILFTFKGEGRKKKKTEGKCK